MKINKGVFGKNILKGLSKLEGSVFHIDTNDFADCLATKFESSDRVTFFKKDTISYITEACFFSCLKLNKSVFGKEIQKRLSKLEGSGVYIDTNIFNECFLTKFKLSNKEVFFKEGTKNLLETCFYNSLKIDKSYIAKIVLKELSSLKYLGYDIDTINCIDCLVSKYESLGKDALFNKDTVSFIINGCVFSSMRINKDSVLRIALLEFCKDSLAKIRSDLKKLSIEGEESLETYCDCFAKNLLKIGDSKRKEVINEWKSLSGEYNNGVVFPCIQLAQNKARQKNDMYNPNDIIGSVDSSTIELLRIGDSKMVQVTIGDITKYYVLDTGADLLIIDDKSEHELISNKKLLPSMFIGEKQLTLADNRQVNAKIYKINNVRIGDYIVRNIEIGVIENGFLLCGMSLLKKFKDWKIESELNVLKLFK
jgi:predicted aspartyl protease